MGIFDKLFGNRAWQEFRELPKGEQREWGLVITALGSIRSTVAEGLIRPTLETAIELGIEPHLGSRGREKVLQSAISEAKIALLACCEIPPTRPASLEFLTWEEFHTYVFRLMLVELSETDPSLPSRPRGVNYSREPREAMNQYLVRFSKIFQLRDTETPSKLKRRGFEKAWVGMANTLLSGMDEGASRVEPDLIISRGKKDFRRLSSKAKDLLKSWVADPSSASGYEGRPSSTRNEAHVNTDSSHANAESATEGVETQVASSEKQNAVSGYTSGDPQEPALGTDPNRAVLGIMLQSSTWMADLLGEQDKQKIMRWADTPSLKWTETEDLLFSLIVNHVIKQRKDIKLPTALSQVREGLSKLKLPPLPEPLTEEIEEICMRVLQKL